MTQYIDKAAVVAEINRQHKKLMTANNIYGAQFVLGFRQACRQIIDFLNTLEVKDVDSNKELSLEDYKSFFKKHPDLSDDWGFDEAWMFAKYFYELGLKVQKGE